HPALPGCSLSQRAGMKRGTGARDATIPKSRSPSISSWREECWAAWMDAQCAAHVAHAVDPWVLDACPGRRERTRGLGRTPEGTMEPKNFSSRDTQCLVFHFESSRS